jgi:hypothetical protein
VNQDGYAALAQTLEQLGWSEGRNVRIERRSAHIAERAVLNSRGLA